MKQMIRADWIIHPLTKYINNRPDWLSNGKGKLIVFQSLKFQRYPILVLLQKDEYEQMEFQQI
jgi:hypothetical protein